MLSFVETRVKGSFITSKLCEIASYAHSSILNKDCLFNARKSKRDKEKKGAELSECCMKSENENWADKYEKKVLMIGSSHFRK